jgi:alpha-beta hydrolase superfamily lysophospholipase
MRTLRLFLALVVLLAALAAGAWISDPKPHWPQAAAIAAPMPGDDLDQWLATREAVFPDIIPGTEKHITWAGEPGQRTPVALIYLHGFSATRQEISPVAERIAAALGANLFATRLAGHGRPGAALADATLTDWATDLAEAMAVARRLGDRIVLIGTSTGGSIATLAALDPAYRDEIAALVMVSPNYGLNDSQAWLLDLPHARVWVPMAVGETYEWQPRNDRHARYWTTRYPTTALFPMRAVQREAAAANHAAATVPALIFYAAGDQVVDPAATARVIQAWGARVDAHVVEGADDPGQHVLAGDILSPSTTDLVVETTLAWLADLGLAPTR